MRCTACARSIEIQRGCGTEPQSTAGPGLWPQSKTEAERRKETALQGSFPSEGTGDRRGLRPWPRSRSAFDAHRTPIPRSAFDAQFTPMPRGAVNKQRKPPQKVAWALNGLAVPPLMGLIWMDVMNSQRCNCAATLATSFR